MFLSGASRYLFIISNLLILFKEIIFKLMFHFSFLAYFEFIKNSPNFYLNQLKNYFLQIII